MAGIIFFTNLVYSHYLPLFPPRLISVTYYIFLTYRPKF